MSDYPVDEVVSEDGMKRVRIMLDVCAPEQPYNDYATPIIQLIPSRYYARTWDAELVDNYGIESWKNDGLKIEVADALNRVQERSYGDYPFDFAKRVVDRWLRVFYGGRLEVFDAPGSSYASYVTENMVCKGWGSVTDGDTLRPNVTEWAAWLDGEVYGIVEEVKVVEEVTVRDMAGKVIRTRVMETWDETGEACWGFYGLEHARTEACLWVTA